MTFTPEEQAWHERARTKDLLHTAQALGVPVKRTNQGAPCPIPGCGGTDRFSVSRPKQRAFCRECGARDGIQLVMDVKGYSFEEACEYLTGEPRPGGRPSRKVAETKDKPIDLPEAQSKEERDKESEAYRRKEIETARRIWEAGEDAAGTAVGDYLAARGIAFSPHWPLKFAPEQPYWHTWKDDDKPTLLHTGPAMLAAITDDGGVLVGCHITWLDPDEIGAKIKLDDLDEPGACSSSAKRGSTQKYLPAKKVRGSKRKAAIKLVSPKGATKLIMGEGIETTLSAYEVYRSSFAAASMAFWAGIDLGHIAGKSAKSVPHPTAKNEKTGKSLMVQGPFWEPEPDRDLVIPETVRELILLGDGDSDPFATEMALRRAVAKFSTHSAQVGQRPVARTIRVAWAPPGADFNDVLLGKAA